MRNSMLGLPRLKLEILRRKKSALKGVRKKSRTKFTGESGLLILISRIMKAQSKEEAKGGRRRNHPVSLVGRRPKMADHMVKGLIARSLFIRALIVRILMKQSLTNRDVIKTGLTTMSLGTATKRQR